MTFKRDKGNGTTMYNEQSNELLLTIDNSGLRVGHWKNDPPSSPYLCSKSIRFSHSFILRKLVSPTPHSKNLNFKPWLRIYYELDTAREASDSQDASVQCLGEVVLLDGDMHQTKKLVKKHERGKFKILQFETYLQCALHITGVWFEYGDRAFP